MVQKTGKQYVYRFAAGARHTDGDGTQRLILGGKGAALAELCRAGAPVPPGFTISAEACAYVHRHDGREPPGLWDQIRSGLRTLHQQTGCRFGNPRQPLLLVVRSDAPRTEGVLPSTVLHLGLCDRTILGFIARIGSERAGWDGYRRLIEQLGPVALGADRLTANDFEKERRRLCQKFGARHDAELTAAQLKELVEAYLRLCQQKTRHPFPQDPLEQLRIAIRSAFQAEASGVRLASRVMGLLGSAVQVQAMVFGNLGPDSGVGRISSRDGTTGEASPSMVLQVGAEGGGLTEAGQTPRPCTEVAADLPSASWKEPLAQLNRVMQKLEQHYRYSQDIDFVVERGALWILQSQPAQRTGTAGVRWAVEMATGRDAVTGHPVRQLLTPSEALSTLSGSDLVHLLGDSPEAKVGAAPARRAAKAKLTWSARLYRVVSDWIDEARRLQVRAVAESVQDVRGARALGADGVGLFRMESLLSGADRMALLQDHLLAASASMREGALAQLLLPLQADWEQMFSTVEGQPVTAQLLETPLRSFLPVDGPDLKSLAARHGQASGAMRGRVEQILCEQPALMRSGAQLSLANPDVLSLQVRAFVQAAVNVARSGLRVSPELLIPRVRTRAELDGVVQQVRAAVGAIVRGQKGRVRLQIGAMIAVPRAALTADELAETAEFFCFQTDVLTALAFGDQPEDAAGGLNTTPLSKVSTSDTGLGWDAAGVGQLMAMGVRKGREVRPELRCGWVGEATSDPAGIRFAEKIGLQYVLCAPARVPMARLAAAQAALMH